MDNEAQRVLERVRLRRVEFEEQIKTIDEDCLSNVMQKITESEVDVQTWPALNENEDKENSLSPSKYGLRNAVKMKLDKLGKLYAGEEVSSPIHRSREIECVSPKSSGGIDAGKLSQARSARLAALANTINNWEDDLSYSKKISPVKVGPTKPKILGERNVKENPISKSPEKKTPIKQTKNVIIVDSIAKTLEAQGFQRCESKQHLVYDYSSPGNSPGKCLNKVSPIKTPNKNIKPEWKKDNLKPTSQSPTNAHRFLPSTKPVVQTQREVLKLAAKYEGSSSPKKVVNKDPAELSLADRKALFERGDNGTAILPKAPFAMAVPTKMLRNDENKCMTPMRKTPDSKVIITNSITTPTLTPVRFKTEIAERPAVGDNVTREILERRKEIEDLRNRWTRKRKEVEDKLQDGENSVQNTPTSAGNNIPVPPPLPNSPLSVNNSPSTFRNGSRMDSKTFVSPASLPKREKRSISPSVKIALKSVKPIRLSPPKGLYPSIEDIETDSDMLEEERHSDIDVMSEFGASDNGGSINDVHDSSLESENSAVSFGKHIVASSRENSRSNLKRPANMKIARTPSPVSSEQSGSISSEQNLSSENSQQNITADESRVLHEIDDFLDEALGEPTPPKKLKEYKSNNDTISSHTPVQQNISPKKPDRLFITPKNQCTPPQLNDEEQLISNKSNDAPNTPLLYTVSLYRKQKQQLKIPVKREIHHDVAETLTTPTEDDEEENSTLEEELVKKRMEELQIEIKRQITIISQASQALNLCMSSIEFNGSKEELEAEKLLLLANARRLVATHEFERLTVEQKLDPNGKNDAYEDGTLKIESLAVKAKRIPSALEETIHLLCLVKSGCTVHATEILPLTRQALTDNNRLLFKKPIQIEHVKHNLQTTVEVYALTNKSFMHHMRGEISKEKLKMTPKKSAKKENKRHFGIIESPAGPNAVRSPSFQMVGFVVFSLKDISRNHFTLNKVPGSAPIEGFLEMNVTGEVNLDNLRHEGFLTIFQEVGGFGTWKRAWCIMKGYHLSFCSYPEPKRAMASCFETIDLSSCITREVGLAPKDVCVRADTLMLECKEIGKDKEIVRYLISADTLQERLHWSHYINKILNILRLWMPINK